MIDKLIFYEEKIIAVCKNCQKQIYRYTDEYLKTNSITDDRWYHVETSSILCFPFIEAKPFDSWIDNWHDDWF